MFIERTVKAIGDTTRIVVDLSNPIWLDVSETITTVVNAAVSLGASGWTVQQPPQSPPVVPYDPTPLTLQSTTIVAGTAGASSAVQFFVQSGTPGNVYTVQCVANGSSTRAITIQVTVQISGTPPTPPNTGFNPPAGAVSPYLSLTGGTMTGPLLLSETPLAAAEAAPKSYVDTETTARTTAVTAETTRATAAEATLTTNVAANTATIATNTTAIATNATAIATETTRATAAEVAAIASALASSSWNNGRNRLHNSFFRIKLRGSGAFTASNVYTADRWTQLFVNGTLSTSFVALTDSDRSVIGDEEAEVAMQCTCAGGSSAGDFTVIIQRIENLKRISGKTIVLSFWAKASSGTPKVGFDLQQVFGTGGSPSATVTAIGSGSTAALSSVWTRYSTVINVPSIAGKTFGTTTGTDFTQLDLWLSSGSTNNAEAGNIGVQSGTVLLWGMQLELGSVVTPIERIDPVRDQANCQKFYNTISTFVGPTATYATSYSFPVKMRAIPTVAGGGAGYTTSALDTNNVVHVQTAGAVQTLTFTADL